MLKIAIIGAGGFAREVAWLIRDINRKSPRFEFAGYLVSDLEKLGPHDSRSEVLGDFNYLENHPGEVEALAIGIGTPHTRLRLASELESRFPHMQWPALVHPSVQLDADSAQIGKGVLLCASVVGTVNLVLEPYAMVNLSCTLGHEAVVGRGSVLNPSVNLSGGVCLGEGVLVGTGAQVLQYLSVGAGASIGSGAVVTKDVAPGVTVVGVPAKPLVREK